MKKIPKKKILMKGILVKKILMQRLKNSSEKVSNFFLHIDIESIAT